MYIERKGHYISAIEILNADLYYLRNDANVLSEICAVVKLAAE